MPGRSFLGPNHEISKKKLIITENVLIWFHFNEGPLHGYARPPHLHKLIFAEYLLNTATCVWTTRDDIRAGADGGVFGLDGDELRVDPAVVDDVRQVEAEVGLWIRRVYVRVPEIISSGDL